MGMFNLLRLFTIFNQIKQCSLHPYQGHYMCDVNVYNVVINLSDSMGVMVCYMLYMLNFKH